MNKIIYSGGPDHISKPLFLTQEEVKTIVEPSSVIAHAKMVNTFSGFCPHHTLVQENDVFIASEYTGYSGSEHIQEALQRGAKGVILHMKVANHMPKQLIEFPTFVCSDTLLAYRSLARCWRNKVQIPIIAIGGSVGKSTTTLLIYTMLNNTDNVILATQNNENGFVGIPYTLGRLRNHHRAAVIEIGIDEIGAMTQHDALLRPTAAVLTNLGAEHLRGLKTVELACQEELTLFVSVAARQGTLFINLDDQAIVNGSQNLKTDKYFYTLADRIPFQTKTPKDRTLTGVIDGPGRLIVSGMGIEKLLLSFSLFGRHNHRNVLAAACIAIAFGQSIEAIQQNLLKIQPIDGRCEIRRVGTRTLICDHYNAQPQSVAAALALLEEYPEHGERIACLGNVDDLGTYEQAYHIELASKLFKSKLDRFLLIGLSMELTYKELQRLGNNKPCNWFRTKDDFLSSFPNLIPHNSIVLIKGSFRLAMQNVVDGIIQESLLESNNDQR